MTRRSILFVLVTAGVVFAAQTPEAKHTPQSTVSRPGLGVGGIGVSAVFVPAPGVTTPTVASKNITTPAVTSNPGVTSRNTTTQQVTSNPGVNVPGVAAKSVTAAPGVATRAPATSALPKGYFTSIPSTADQRMYKGELCYYVDGVYYRAEYYMGSLVYVKVS